MAGNKGRPTLGRKRGTVSAEAGQPLKFIEEENPSDQDEPRAEDDPYFSAIAETLAAYRKAAHALLEGKYADQKQIAPLHMREPYDIFVIRCIDGIFVRYDLAPDGEGSVRCAETKAGVAEIAPRFSENMIHLPSDPSTYIPPDGGPVVSMLRSEIKTGITEELLRYRPLIYAKPTLPDNFELPKPPARPPFLVSVNNEFHFQIGGFVAPSDSPLDPQGPDAQCFIAQGSRTRLPVGWQTIEIYSVVGEEYWKPEYASTWAELDLLAVIAQINALQSSLTTLDGRGATRSKYASVLEEFKGLLNGLEEPVHQFLKEHHELLCPTATAWWSKLDFGDRVSDFVFREPYDDYLLVEIEAPIRKLFRQDGQQREELTHAINQTLDWIQHIANNREKVEQDLGLRGISTNPRTLIVIGRSDSLTEDDRRKLVTIQAQHNKLRILTYDDVLATARTTLERILGPLSLQGQNAELYYYKSPPDTTP
jgi:antiviral defense system Shedu protein SduA